MIFSTNQLSISDRLKKKVFISDVDILKSIQPQLSEQNIETNHLEDFRPDKMVKLSAIYIVSQNYITHYQERIKVFAQDKIRYNAQLFFIGSIFPDSIPSENIDVIVPEPVNIPFLLNAIKNGFTEMQQRSEIESLQRELQSRTKQVHEFSNIGRQLMMEKDLNTLLNRILSKCREVSNADAGSLYLVEEIEKDKKQLRFMITQNDSVSFDFQEFVMPISRKSVSGFVADTGKMLNIKDVYKLPKRSEFSVNKSFDKKVGYRTKSMLVIPLRNHIDEINGVLQLINCKKDFSILLKKPKDFKTYVGPFPEKYIEMVTALAAQAAISIENNLLYRNIERLFEGFVNASVTAIESRDPTTSGHSSRVAILTENLAKAINKIHRGPLKDVKFTSDQLKELRYASLLHDFGKVGVREEVLLKAKKLYPHQLIEVLNRIKYMKKLIEIEDLKKRIDFLVNYGAEHYHYIFSDYDSQLKKVISEVDDITKTIIDINEPSIMGDEKLRFLEQIAQLMFLDSDGTERRILEDNEVNSLRIKRGSLSEEEYKEIESHVMHTFNFLSKVPWTKDIKHIPQIAYTHHEKLNGEGYPNRLTAESIPIQSRMIAISDIFDALTASDRPYKKAVPFERALQILQYEVSDNHIDKNLLKVFIEAEIYKSVLP